MTKTIRRRKTFFKPRSPTTGDIINYIHGDVWFDLIDLQTYTFKCRKGCKKRWHIHKSSGHYKDYPL
jgi:hypothetical protein